MGGCKYNIRNMYTCNLHGVPLDLLIRRLSQHNLLDLETVAMCVCVKHVIVGCCFVLLLLGTSMASASVRIYKACAGHHFQSVIFLHYS